MNEQNYIKKRGKLKTAIAACLATMVFGTAVGFGGSQLLIQVLNNATDGGYSSSAPRGNQAPNDVDRNNLPGVFDSDAENNPTSNPVDESSETTSVSTLGNNTEEYNAAELYENLSDTVVGIKIAYNNHSDYSEIIGSGVIISEEGFIITCAHVIDNAEKVLVVVDDYDDPDAPPHEYEAKIYGSDAPTDLAVIKIERDEPFKYAQIGSSSSLKIGQTVVAIGNPVGLVKTMTQGIVSGLQRDLGDNTYMLPSIQTDAALNPGNSGCPLFDMYGNVVGIVNIKLVYGSQLDNLGFAISIDEAMPVIEELAKHGHVTNRPMLGITASEVSSMYRNDSWEDGLLIETIRPGTPAAESGLSRNDIIIKIDGEYVASVSDIQSIIKEKNVGDIVTVTVIRYNNYGEEEELAISFALTSSG